MAVASKLLSGLYGVGVATRNLAFDVGVLPQRGIDLPVICVGNVTAGGTGKTPFVRFLVKSLIELGAKPGILLRGYRGSYTGVGKVDRGDSVELVGDEAVLYTEWFGDTAPVVVSRKRIDGADALQQLGVTHIIMDDGFQHRGLKRDVNLLLLDVSTELKVDEWRNGDLLPAGRLRESLSSALPRADAVVFVDKGDGEKGDIESPSGFSGQVFTFKLQIDPIVDMATGAEVVAVCAIGSPDAFFEGLKRHGLILKNQVAYPDHHSFREQDWDELRSVGLPIVCTEKDAVKLKHFTKGGGELIVVGQSGSFASDQERVEFWRLIERRLAKRAARNG